MAKGDGDDSCIGSPREPPGGDWGDEVICDGIGGYCRRRELSADAPNEPCGAV